MLLQSERCYRARFQRCRELDRVGTGIMPIIETLAPDPRLERETRQASGNLIDIAAFNPEGLQELAQTCNQLYDMVQCVAFSVSSIGMRPAGFPEGDPFSFVDLAEPLF